VGRKGFRDFLRPSSATSPLIVAPALRQKNASKLLTVVVALRRSSSLLSISGTEEKTVICLRYILIVMTKRSHDATSDLAMWAIFKAFVATAVVFVVLMLLADVLWVVCPRLVEPLLR
jgi:hypothetical protein